MQGNKSLNEKRIHPTQKPVVLYDWIFKNYAEPGQKVLDTHLGSGSSRIAAYEAGLDFIGFEMLENEFETFVAEFYTGRPLWKRRNLNIPERWEAVQDKRRNTSPLGRSSYLHKARKVKSLARSVHTRIAPHRGAKKGDVEQCKRTFKITDARCAPCNGYNTECEHYEKNDAADTKHSSSLA